MFIIRFLLLVDQMRVFVHIYYNLSFRDSSGLLVWVCGCVGVFGCYLCVWVSGGSSHIISSTFFFGFRLALLLLRQHEMFIKSMRVRLLHKGAAVMK